MSLQRSYYIWEMGYMMDGSWKWRGIFFFKGKNNYFKIFGAKLKGLKFVAIYSVYFQVNSLYAPLDKKFLLDKNLHAVIRRGFIPTRLLFRTIMEEDSGKICNSSGIKKIDLL